MSGYLLLSKFCQSYQAIPYLISPGKQLSYADLYIYSSYLHTSLKQRGICCKERIAILCEDNFHTALLLLALFRLGAIAVPLAVRLPFSNVLTSLQNINCTKLLISKKFLNSNIEKNFSFIIISSIYINY